MENRQQPQMPVVDSEAAAKLADLDDIVKILDLDQFNTSEPIQIPVVYDGSMQVEGLQFIGNTLGPVQPAEITSYVDPWSPAAASPASYTVLSPASPHCEQTENSNQAYHLSGGSVATYEAITPPASPYLAHTAYATATVNTSYVDNTIQDTRQSAGGKSPRGRKGEAAPKPKLYQREEPLEDPEAEKKRLNAINAKKNRDKNKNRMNELESQVAALTAEREALQLSNSKLQNKCGAFEKQLKLVCERFNVPVVILPED